MVDELLTVCASERCEVIELAEAWQQGPSAEVARVLKLVLRRLSILIVENTIGILVVHHLECDGLAVPGFLTLVETGVVGRNSIKTEADLLI